MVWDNDRRRSRRLAEYTDKLVLRRRNQCAQPESPDEDDEVATLGALAAELTNLDVSAPPGFQDELAAQLRQTGTQATPAGHRRGLRAAIVDAVARAANIWSFGPAPLGTAVALVVLLAVIVAVDFGRPPVVSAEEVLARSDEALAATVHPGEVLKRTWRVQVTSWARAGSQPVVRERVVHEWMDGSDFEHVAGQSETTDGRRRAYATYRQNGTLRSVAFDGGDARAGQPAALNLEPTSDEYLRAVETFPPDARRILHAYLNRHFIYRPIAGERRFNRQILEGTLGGPMPRSVSVDTTVEDGRPAFAVRASDPSRVHFLWRTGSAPWVQLAREEGTSYIARDSYLTIKSQQDTHYRAGRRTLEVRTLEDMRTFRRDELTTNPFDIDVPPGTPVNQQSAVDLLTGVLRELQEEPPHEQ